MKTSRAAIVRADDPEYWELKAQETLGEVVLLGERYTKDAVLEAAFLVDGPIPSYVDNPDEGEDVSVQIGEDFYSLALRDYQNWPIKWWREAIQNSVDAGATRITCSSKYIKETGLWSVACEDNGGGMDKETLITKFLVLGASGKRGDPTKKGGFGKAKEMLILPWVSWEVHTRDVVVRGSGGRGKAFSAEFLSGTKLTVTMPDDYGKFTTAQTDARSFLAKCYLPGIEFRIAHQNEKETPAVKIDDLIVADKQVGRLIKEFPKGLNVYFKETDPTDSKSSSLFVRVDGLYMFSKSIYTSIQGQLIAETNLPSIQVLTANREGFAVQGLSYDLDDFCGSLVKKEREVLRDTTGLIRKKFKGSGKFTAAREQQFAAMFQDILATMGGTGRPISGQGIILTPSQTAEYTKAAHDILGNFQKEREVPEGSPKENIGVGAPSDYAVPPDAIKALMSIAFTGPTHLEAAIKQLAWEPDYFLANDIPGFLAPKVFWPATMSAKVKKLVRFWAELCRFVLIQIGCPDPYGVGCHFSNEVAGSNIRDEGETFLLINPIKVTVSRGKVVMGDPVTSPIYDIGDSQDVATLYSIAVHECTHFADGLSDHDEAFAAAMTFNVARTSGREKEIREILRAIKSRTAGEGPYRTERPKREETSDELAQKYANRVVKDAIRKGMSAEDAGKFWTQAYQRYVMTHEEHYGGGDPRAV
jgi:hypothetical protein